MNVGLGGRVTPAEDGAHLVLQTEFQAGRLAGLTLPLIRRRMWPEFEGNIHRIKAILESSADRPLREASD